MARKINDSLNKLDSLGTSKDSFEVVTGGSSVVECIELALGNFIQRVIKNIQDADMIVTGQIEDISIQVESDVVNVLANEYLVYQDKGVNPSGQQLYNTPFSYRELPPPYQVFIDYIKTKNLQLRNNETYYGKPSPHKDLTDEEEIEKAAHAMAMSIFKKKGIKPRDIYSREIPQLIKDIQSLVTGFAAEQIKEVFVSK
ncbi:hypothetical protein DCC81_23970 [Chitinophaga parva]|uniref:Uncharacterized protein n=1 Tax=Chitinophaga parva TaxID=2169414 RepID=A0A2T7BEB5_9BACT|nr:hypothetical protein [Chitinophaga parva]PUZ23439.1 hypothetical protein DCC81_23970 [Chitinophaga parva]